MKILIAPDKFKDSLTAREVCSAIESGLIKSEKRHKIIAQPMADGGDGSLAVLSDHLKLKAQNTLTTDPLGRKISAQYFTSSKAAFIEVASASGLVLLKKEERNPLKTSTYGTGKMIADAISKGYQQIYLFLGGSATNDAGIGIAAALGYQFLDENKKVLAPIGGNLPFIKYIKPGNHFDFNKIKMTLLCDVTNPLFGKEGAAYIYAPQKGATDEQVKYSDDGLRHFANIVYQQIGMDVSNLPGSGAAGGIGAGLVALFGAKLEIGFDAISKLTGLEKQIQWADWVISGEGKLDVQTFQGKVVPGVAALCQKYKKPLVLFVGKNELEEKDRIKLKASYIFSISKNTENLEDAMVNGAVYLEKMADEFNKLLNLNFNK